MPIHNVMSCLRQHSVKLNNLSHFVNLYNMDLSLSKEYIKHLMLFLIHMQALMASFFSYQFILNLLHFTLIQSNCLFFKKHLHNELVSFDVNLRYL